MNRRQKLRRRWMAFVLSCAIMLSVLPAPALAMPYDNPNHPLYYQYEFQRNWTAMEGSGKSALDLTGFKTKFESNFDMYLKRAVEGYTDSNNVSFTGLVDTNGKVSDALVMECIMDALMTCSWASKNAIYCETNYEKINLFYNKGSVSESPLMIGHVSEELNALYDLMVSRYGTSTLDVVPGETNYKYVGSAMDMPSVKAALKIGSRTDDSSLVGSGEFDSAVGLLMKFYVQANVMAALSKDIDPSVAEGKTLLQHQSEIANAIIAKATGSSSSGSGEGDGSGETTPPASETAGNFNDTIVNDSTLVLGDTWLGTFAREKGWYTDPESNIPTFFNVTATGDHPNFSVLEYYPDLNMTPPEYTNWGYWGTSDDSFSVDAIDEVYIMYGRDRLFALGEAQTYEDQDPDYYDSWFSDIFGVGIGQLINTFTNGGKTPRIRIATVDSSGADDNTKKFITQANEWLKEYAASATTAKIEVVDVTSLSTGNSTGDHTMDATSATAYWNAITSKVTGNANSGSSGDTLTGNESTNTKLTSLQAHQLYQDNRDALKVYFDVYEHVRLYATELWNYGYADHSSGGQDYEGYFKELTSWTFEMNDLFMDLYEYGYLKEDASTVTPDNFDANVDNNATQNAKSVLDLISNCDIQNHEIIIPSDGNPELNLIGYVALASGVIYDPFVSIAGDEDYFALLHTLLPGAEDDSVSIIDRFLQQALNTKKPLYVMDGAKSKWLKESQVEEAPTGDYRFATLEDVLQHDENVTRVYAVMKGGMSPSKVDGSTWEYLQAGVKQDQSSTSASITGEATDDNATIKTESSGTGAIVAGSTVMATSQQMSAPVMFTSGTTNGFVKGNWNDSASGYAASVGGITTMVVHNAAQDAKSNQYIQHPGDYMLYMNGLGDIVMADGTVILPAIANPIIYTYGDNIQYDVNASWGTAGGILGGALCVAGAIGGIVLSGGTAIPVIIGIGLGGGAGLVLGEGASAILSTVFDGNAPDEVKELYNSACGYYPYTAAFMNHYPSAIINTEGKLAVTNSNDKGKYLIGIDTVGNVLGRRIEGFNNKTQVNLMYSGGGITVAPVQGLSFNVSSDTQNTLGTAVPYYGGEDGTFWSKFNTAHDFEYYMVKDTIYSSTDQAYFPLTSDSSDLSDSYLDLAGPLVTSARRFITERNPSGEVTKHHETFDVERYIVTMCGEGLQGTQYAETLQKNYKISYDEMVEDTGNRLLVFFTQLVESAIENLGKIDGVLAIKNCYENSFFNLIIQFIQEFYLLIAVVLLIIVAVKFLRGHYNMIFVLFISLMCVCGFEVYANWMPTMIPAMYNFAVNDSIEQVVWNTVVVSAESYNETYKDSNRKDTTTGALKPYTATITLYKMTRDDMETMASRLGTTYKAIKSGEVQYLDETAGIFVQGDSIKMSVDKLLVNNTIRGLHQSQWQELAADFVSSDEFITPITEDSDQIGNPYSIQLTNPYVSLEAYYMPFNEIERAFMINLNAFASLFRMERNQYSYGRNLYKDAFLFNCFTNSGIFTAPGEGEVLKNNIKVGSVISEYTGEDKEMQSLQAFISRVYGGGDHEGVFKVPEDWLNASAVFRSPSENMKNSMWGQMMQDRQWYDDDWNIINPDALADLIAYMNTQTKQFVIDNLDQLNFCSDENAIKIVSLYATTTFTHYVSQIGKWAYPNYLNAADIELRDVLYGSMTTLKDRNFAYDGTAVNTVAHNLGIFGVLFLLLIAVFATLFVFVMTYLVPVLYALFGAILIFKLVNDKDSVGLVQGYIKVTGVTCLLYFVFSISLRLVEVGGYAWYGYLGCALVMALCCYFLFWVVLSVVQNIGEMGNDVLGQNLLRGIDAITRGAVRKLTTNTLNARRGIRGYGGRGYGYAGYGAPYQYGRGYGIDDRDYVRGSRSLFGRRSGYDARDEYGYNSYSRGSSYDDSMYYREGRRGFTGFVHEAARLREGMGRWASSRRNRSSQSTETTSSQTDDRAS